MIMGGRVTLLITGRGPTMMPSTVFYQIHLGRASRDSWILPWHTAAPWTPCPVTSTGGTFRTYGKALWKWAPLAILGR